MNGVTVLELELLSLESGDGGNIRFDVPKEFHVSLEARKKYRFNDALFSLNGNVVFADFRASREFAQAMNSKRNTARHPEKAVKAGQINAMGLIDEILHYVVTLYRERYGAGVFKDAVEAVKTAVGAEGFRRTLLFFVEEFPPLEVYRNGLDPEKYLLGSTGGTSNEEIALEELLLLWLANDNPAFAPFGELFDDTDLRGGTSYLKVVGEMRKFFAGKPAFGPFDETLIDMLKAPAVASPYSLPGQLDYIRKHWGLMIGSLLERLLKGIGVIKEEEKVRWGFGPGPTQVPDYSAAGFAEEEFERFSPDKDWMPKLVLIAKSTLVWLHQLSRKYGREIRTIDQIPDEELDLLASRGITGLWFIGVWERSKASRRIKELCGNLEAAASAYSLYDYDVAEELGGWAALDNLRKRAWVRGIRLASDMVPNHTGIDSRWMIEHPDWFIQTRQPPFPGYRFGGENLSFHRDVEVAIEDHYFDRTDASVVFRRIHVPSGDVRYIYHGNDGTHMPWNDTAQLNFLLPEVREAVIRTILHVAKNFPIIRFDAAMTLAKRHFQRLWYPEPGSGGDIPSRAEYGLTKDEFNKRFPVEFWREVVDRAAVEAPDTLLLAEAFWMMEGYFVRTLGMHRVYNSAFMNMLKNEENSKYRYTIKNTQEFDKNILKRFVNFMNNPDEETAIAQFGDGDKYFGVCTLMVTMPGLPMFGHGQIEGFREKYGMEYRKAYQDEAQNEGLVARHDREIFPLLKRRYLFAEVENFLLYDLFREGGGVNENVFAYSNRVGNEAVLVLYNNSLEPGWGWIRMSAAYAEKRGEGDKALVQKSLGEGLGLSADGNRYALFREQRSGLWFIRSSRDIHEKGLFVSLGGYECQVFLDFYQVEDDGTGMYGRLLETLNGAGMESVENSLRELRLKPLLDPFRRILWDMLPSFKKAVAGRVQGPRPWESPEFLGSARSFLEEAKKFANCSGDAEKGIDEILEGCAAAAAVLELVKGGKLEAVEGKAAGSPREEEKKSEEALLAFRSFAGKVEFDLRADGDLLFTWILLRGLGPVGAEIERERPETARRLTDEFGLDWEFTKYLASAGIESEQAERLRLLLKILLEREDWFVKSERFEKLDVRARVALEELFTDQDVRQCSGVNRFNGELYFNREGFLALLSWLGVAALVRSRTASLSPAEVREAETGIEEEIGRWFDAFGKADYLLDRLLDLLDPEASARKADLEKG